MNEVEIRVTSKDHTKPGFASAESGAERLNNRLRALNGRFSALKAAALGLGPALLPVMAVGAAGAVGLGTALASAGAAVGVFGAVTKSAFTEVQEASKKSEDLREKIRLLKQQAAAAPTGLLHDAYMKRAAAATAEYNARLAQLPPTTRAAVRQYDAMRGSWRNFVDANKPAVYGIMADGMGTIGRSVGRLQPLFDVGARYARQWVDSVSGWVDGGGLTRTVAFLTGQADPALSKLTGIISALSKTAANLAGNAAFSESGGLLNFLLKGAQALAAWSGGNGLSRFMDYLSANGPAVTAALASIALAAVHIAQAVAPLAPISLAVAAALASIIAALPPGVITAMVASYIALSIVLRTVGVATKLWAGAQLLLNLALTANPIGLVVVAVALLVAGIVIAYQRSETFRRAMGLLWDLIKTGAVGAAKGILWFVDKLLAGMSLVFGALGKVPGAFGAPFRAAQRAVDAARGKVNELQGAIDRMHGKNVPVYVVQYGADRVQREINSITGKVVAIQVGRIGGAGSVRGFAHGGITGAAGGGPRGGLVEVGEHGRELLDLPPGTRVRSNPDTERIMAGAGQGGGRMVLEIRSGGSQLDDLLVEVLRNAVRVRGGNVQVALGRGA